MVKSFDSLLSPVEAMIPTFSPVPIKVPIVSKISVNEKARIAIKTPGKRETSEKSDPNPFDQALHQRPDQGL